MAYMAKKMVKQSRKNIDEDERILVHCSAGRGRTGTLIVTFLIAEHLLSISESCFPGANIKETGAFDTRIRIEPDKFYIENEEDKSIDKN